MSNLLDSVFNPRAVAVIGASETPGKAGERRTRSLIEGGYKGDIYLINPKRSELFSKKAYPSITDIPNSVDLVMIAISPKALPSAVADSVKAGAKGVIIITAGLGETGEEGKKIEAQILEEAKKGGTRVIGPNCSGMFSASADMNLLGVPTLKKGSIAILAQSGNIIDSLTHYAQMRGLGFSKIISAGNAIGVKFPEYIEYLANDHDTRVILTFLESIKNGNELVKVAREAAKKKPIIMIKAGRSEVGARAAASHTGALAADNLIVEAAFRQAGIIRAYNIDEMFDIAEAFINCPTPNGNRAVIMSEGGGDNSIAADNCAEYGIELPVLSSSTQEQIKPFLLAGMPTRNPIDYGGTAEENPHVITECVNACMRDSEVDGIFITGFFGGFKDIIAGHVAELERQTAHELVNSVKKYKKPLFVHTSFAQEPIESLQILKSNGIPVIPSSERTARCLSTIMQFAEKQRRLLEMQIPSSEPVERPRVKGLFGKVRSEGRANLLETEARELLQEYGIPLPEVQFISNREEAIASYEHFQQPIAMKIVSPDIVHKSDVGGVKLSLQDTKDVEQAFSEIMVNAEKQTSKERIVGALVSPMAPRGQECIIGMFKDPNFGPVIMFGLGGIFVEVLRDVSFGVVPLANKDIDEMIEGIKGYKVLMGVRGEKPKDIAAIKNVIAKLSQMVTDNPEIREVDLNPVIVHDQGVSIIDSRVIID